MNRAIRCLVLVVGLLAGCGRPAPPAAVTIYAAASTREVIDEVAADFRARTGAAVAVNYGSSSDLARQIERGGAADLFLSADDDWADFLAEQGLVAARQPLLTNRLVVAVPADSILTLRDLGGLADPAVRRLALAGPAVPAGRYAREALQKAGVWARVEKQVLDGGDVRAALTFVARGEAEAGLVYATDVRGNSKVRIALEVSADLHRPIRYPLVRVRREPATPAARLFYEHLASEEAAAVFRRHGFRGES